MNNIDVTKKLYQAFAEGDIPTVLGGMTPDIHWSESAGMPQGGEFTGPNGVAQGVLAPIAEDWAEFQVEIERLIDGGDTVVMQGWYVGTGKASKKNVRARAVHVITFTDGKVSRFVQLADTALVRDALA